MRNFECPKCSGSKVEIGYSYIKELLIIMCRRCEYRWEEKPSDIKKKDAVNATGI